MNWKERTINLMTAKGINQKKLAKLSGVTESSVSRYLRNDQRPRIDVLINFAKALEVNVDYLINDYEIKTESYFKNIATAIARNGSKLTSKEKNKLIMLILGEDECE